MSTFFEQIVAELAAAGIPGPRLETRLLIASVLKIEPSAVFGDTTPDAAQTAEIRRLLVQRLQHKPLDKVLGHREFYKFDFVVDENVLSPRADTEILVEEALRLPLAEDARILDLGTGSGCIIETLLAEKTTTTGVAVDISEKSLQVAQKNAEKLGVDKRLQFMRADWFADDFCERIGEKFDIITANPPYIPTADIATLEPEVKDFDPPAALNGGADGFDSYRRIAVVTPELLKDDAYILLEAGIGQADEIAAVFMQQGLKHIRTLADLSGIDRCVVLQKSK